MGGWIKVDDLKPTAQTLALGVEAIEDAAVDAPATPNAGSSTLALGAAMVSMFDAVAMFATTMAAAADIVQACDANYKTTDQTNADQMCTVDPQPTG